MKSPSTSMNTHAHSTAARRRTALILAGSIGTLLASLSPLGSPSAQAATLVKLFNTDALNLTTSWVGGVVPTAADIALWDATVTGANPVLRGGNLSWKGISITNPGGLVTIGAGNTLTLGTSGIDMSTAAQNLTISSGLTIAQGSQTWDIAAGRTFVFNTGSFTRTAGATLNVTGSGTVTASPTLVNGIIGAWATRGGTSYATVTGGNIVAFTGTSSVIGFATNAAANYDT